VRVSQSLRRLLPSARPPGTVSRNPTCGFVSLRISVAREWIFESARRPELLQALGEETQGLLSLTRPRRSA